jgi:hypothetical protein
MVKVKLFCMQKDEEDILEDWIIYHSYLFGIENLYLIDNNSKSTSLQILRKYQQLGLNLSQQPDYSKKGDYLCDLIKQTQDQCDLAIPLDLDEFIAMVDLKNIPTQVAHNLAQSCASFDTRYYLERYPQVVSEGKTPVLALEHFIKKGFHFQWSPCAEGNMKNIDPVACQQIIQQHRDIILKNYPQTTLTCEKDAINHYLSQLPKYGRYSFLYYLTSRNGAMDYDNPINDINVFDLLDYEQKVNANKKFFDPKRLTSLDHGNHHGRVEGLQHGQYMNTNLVLFHYHHRGVRKLIEKCKNDIIGLGIVKDLNNKQELKEKIKQNVRGAHNIQTYLTYLTSGPRSLMVDDDQGLKIIILSEKIEKLKSNLTE